MQQINSVKNPLINYLTDQESIVMPTVDRQQQYLLYQLKGTIDINKGKIEH